MSDNNKIVYFPSNSTVNPNYYEFCPRCDANLTLQKGYSNDVPYWICKGCGEMLINPNVPDDSNIAWICDKCESMLNIQDGFDDSLSEWTCSECGFVNKIDASEIFVSEDEYQADLNNPYKGISDEDLIELMGYEDVSPIDGREDIIIVKDDNDNLYVKKILATYDISVYEFLMYNPVPNMPKIIKIYKGSKFLVIIEEYIAGKTISEMLETNVFSVIEAVRITKHICEAVNRLHSFDKPIIHRDIKPSNIIVSMTGNIFLLDINVAKWYKPNETEDTKLFGTPYFAAPEQFGYGFSSSSEKADVYAIGILLNVMITGKLPKEQKAPDPIWGIVEKCIKLDSEERFSDNDLIEALNAL